VKTGVKHRETLLCPFLPCEGCLPKDTLPEKAKHKDEQDHPEVQSLQAY